MSSASVRRLVAFAAGLLSPAAAFTQELPPPRPMTIGMNAPGFQYYQSVVPFANLVVGSDWVDGKWERLAEQYQDVNGNILSLPAGQITHRLLSVPPTGPTGIEVRCTWSGSGSLQPGGGRQVLSSAPNRISFRLFNPHKADNQWLTLGDVDPGRPFRDLDCRETSLPTGARFRPEFVRTLHGYGVVRFMDWQNANANLAVTWATRHMPSATRLLDRDGVPIEDMLALTRELGADPWFVMPWNADDTYIAGFAQMVARLLPAGRHVYVEAGNEVWNGAFPVARQAIKEGQGRGLGSNPMEAGMRRYAQRTAEVMRVWEAAFAGRTGLVRVLSTQNAWPDTARTAMAFGDTAQHVDALATAPYFSVHLGGTDNLRETILAQLSADLTATLKNAIANRRVATGFGKRYLAYEGGEELALYAEPVLTDQMQHDSAQFDLYQRYLAEWRRDVGDVLCLYTSIMRPAGNGSWGLAAWEDETPAQAPKLRAVQEAMAPR